MNFFLKTMATALIVSLSISLAAPVKTAAKSFNGSGKVLVQWNQVKDADGYVLYRAASNGKTYTRIKTIDKATILTYRDSGRKVGSTYKYKVCGFTKEQGKITYGEKSKAISVKVKNVIKKDENNKLMLVNKNNWLSSKYVPTDLVSLSSYATGNMVAKKQVKTAYGKLYRAAKTAGYTIKIVSAYRSYATQKSLFDYWCAVDGVTQALRTSAKAGRSEHQTGYALDVSSKRMGWDLQERFGSTPEGKWIAANAHKYGFIVRYGKGKESLTGYAYEPWHIRYIGTEAAKAIHEKNTTLEQFLGY